MPVTAAAAHLVEDSLARDEARRHWHCTSSSALRPQPQPAQLPARDDSARRVPSRAITMMEVSPTSAARSASALHRCCKSDDKSNGTSHGYARLERAKLARGDCAHLTDRKPDGRAASGWDQRPQWTFPYASYVDPQKAVGEHPWIADDQPVTADESHAYSRRMLGRYHVLRRKVFRVPAGAGGGNNQQSDCWGHPHRTHTSSPSG